MFEQIEERPSFGSWVLQSFLAYFGPLILLIATWHYLSTGEDSPALTLCQYAFIGVVSCALAFGIWRILSGATAEGRWVWVIPTVLFLVALVDSASRNMREVRCLFYVGPGEGEAGWGMMLLTMPTWGCCCYSLAMNIWWRQSNRD